MHQSLHANLLMALWLVGYSAVRNSCGVQPWHGHSAVAQVCCFLSCCEGLVFQSLWRWKRIGRQRGELGQEDLPYLRVKGCF